ncbi:MAG: hypothetical protein FD134_1297 [Gallionellaceae bacterium]|nr:MAG: hypothetical protein FD134_1297 [Gallionellaceae bacterium]
MSYQVSASEIKRAQHLHSVLLFDFIVVHVFVFILALSLIKSSYIPLSLMPLLSVGALGYVMFKARRALTQEPVWFVRCHMILAGRRARMFFALFVVTGAFTAAMYFGGGQIGLSPIASLSLAFGLGQLPFMASLLVLIVLEFDAEHQCKKGKIPAAALALHPAPTIVARASQNDGSPAP